MGMQSPSITLQNSLPFKAYLQCDECLPTLDIEFGIDRSFLSALEKCASSFWPPWFMMRYPKLPESFFPYI